MVDVDELLRSFNIGLFERPLFFSSGALLKIQNKWYCIISLLESPARKRFTKAHELAHFILHVSQGINYVFDIDLFSRERLEREANAWAAELLMPTEQVLQDVDGIELSEPEEVEQILSSLARKYEVSAEAMRWRLVNLNILSNGGR